MSLSQKVFIGSLWTLFIYLVNRSIGIVSTLILVRVLLPEDFGIAALATMLLMLFMSLTQLGINQYIIKTPDITKQQISSAWSLQIVVNVLIALSLFLFSGILAHLMGNEKLESVLMAMAIIPILGAVRNPGMILAEKRLDYSRISKIRIGTKLTAVPITIYIAIVYETYWALILGQILTELLFCIMGYLLIPYRASFTFKGYKSIFANTKWLLVSSVSGFLRAKAETFLVNYKFAAEGVGLYNMAREFAHLPMSDIIGPASRPLLAGASSITSGINDVYIAILKYLYVAIFFLLPCVVGSFFIAELFISVVLGDLWIEAVPVFKYISILMLVFILYSCCRILMLLRDDLKILVGLDFISIAVMAVVILPSVVDTLTLLTQIRVAVGVGFAASLLVLIKLRYKSSLSPILNLFATVFILSIPFAVTLHFTKPLINHLPEIIQLSILIVLAITVYFLTVLSVLRLLINTNPYYKFVFEFSFKFIDPILNRLKRLKDNK